MSDWQNEAPEGLTPVEQSLLGQMRRVVREVSELKILVLHLEKTVLKLQPQARPWWQIF